MSLSYVGGADTTLTVLLSFVQVIRPQDDHTLVMAKIEDGSGTRWTAELTDVTVDNFT